MLETVAQLPGVKIFQIAICQISLAESSQHLMTFITLYGSFNKETAIRHLKSNGAFSKEDDQDPGRPAGHLVSCRLCAGLAPTQQGHDI